VEEKYDVSKVSKRSVEISLVTMPLQYSMILSRFSKLVATNSSTEVDLDN
jgi:hypothetical protein